MGLLKGATDQITVPLVAEIDASHGKTVKVPFEATLQNLRWDDAQEVLRSIRERGEGGQPSDEELVRRHLLGWKLPGESGEPVPFTPENLAEALAIRGYREALIAGVMEMLLGRKFVELARRKNS